MSGSGNQIQLVARGNIDASITGNPSITFFKSVYRKHTNFSMEDMIVDTISKPLAGHKYPVKIPTGTGDLLYGTNYILKGNSTYCGNGIANISTAVIDNIVFAIGSAANLGAASLDMVPSPVGDLGRMTQGKP